MTHTLLTTSTRLVVPSAPILICTNPSTTTPSVSSDLISFFFSQQTPLHRGCARWASLVEASVS